MLLHHPSPAEIDFDAVRMAVDPDKDVDGMHPTNVGRLALGIPGLVSCTPAGIEAILAHYDVPVAGKHVVIVGRGVTIGRPLSILLRSEEHTSELQSLMRNSYAVLCLKKNKKREIMKY